MATMSDFILFPAIDLKDGAGVRLERGDMATAKIFAPDPVAQAMAFHAAGAAWLHIVDLNGAFAGASVNGAVVREIVRAFPGQVQLGGGIRDMVAIEQWLSGGVTRLVLGTAALKNPQLVKEAARAFPGRIVVGVDARDGMVATEGWADVSDVHIVDLARRFEDEQVAALLYTDVGRDGLLKGVNVDATEMLAEKTLLPVIASGGVADIRDIEALLAARLRVEGHSGVIEGVISGRAIYDGRLDLGAALEHIDKMAGN
jgi:phosphoribosylformimino-5-aminoimidazole carboxamide ribotide isomerase